MPRTCHQRAAGADRGSRRSHRSVHVLAGADRPRGEALAPGAPDDPVQYVDARDLAAWMVQTAERGTVGVFNATGPERPLGIGAMLASCAKATPRPASLTWVPEKFLEEHRVSAWEDMPVWTGGPGGFSRIDCAKAIRAGLRFRSRRRDRARHAGPSGRACRKSGARSWRGPLPRAGAGSPRRLEVAQVVAQLLRRREHSGHTRRFL